MSERETALKAHADPDMGHGWFVTAGRWGDALVTIEEKCLSGKPEFTPEDESLIRGAALHLLAFIGSSAQPGDERCEWCKYSFIPTRRGKQRQRFCCPHCAQSWLAANRGADVVDRLKAQARAIETILRASGCPSMPLPEGVQWLANRVPEAAGADPVPVCQWREIATAPKDGTEVLLFHKGAMEPDYVSVGAYVTLETSEDHYRPGWCSAETGQYVDSLPPTHWMPLPAPPVALVPAEGDRCEQ